MPRLLRPHIPLKVRCRVALRQLGEMWPGAYLDGRCSFGLSVRAVLDELLERLAALLNCDVKALHLDHDPALGAREKIMRKGVHVGYRPDANDPEHLYYREAVSHRVKTNVRGEHGQHPDRVLIKKQRRLERAQAGVQVDSRKGRLTSRAERIKRDVAFRGKNKVSRPKPKRKWPKGRKIQSRNDLRRRRP